MATMDTMPVNDTGLLFPIMKTTPGNGIDPFFPITSRPYSDSSCSGPPSGGCTFCTFNSSTATNPLWHEPVRCLQRRKGDVAYVMRSLRKQGEDALAVILRQPLRMRWQHTNFLINEGHAEFLMEDGRPLPDDLGFWKASHAYFYREWYRIRVARGEVVCKLKERKRNPVLDCRIQGWVTGVEAARDADGLENIAEATEIEWPSAPEFPAVSARQDMLRSTCRYNITGDALSETSSTQGRKRKSIDTTSQVDHEHMAWRKRWLHSSPGYDYSIADDESDEGKILLAKRLKRKPADTGDQGNEATMPPSKRRKRQEQNENASEKRHTAPAKQRCDGGKKVEVPVAPTRQSSRIAARRKELVIIKLESADTVQVKQPQQPPRRSRRIAELNKAKKIKINGFINLGDFLPAEVDEFGSGSAVCTIRMT